MGPESLNEYLRSVAGTPFKWGQHDCLTFSNAAFSAFHGAGWADDWMGKYMGPRGPLSLKACLEMAGTATMLEFVDSRLTRVNYVPPRGSLVVCKTPIRRFGGMSFGISLGAHAAFVGTNGLIHKNIKDISGAWVA